MADDTLVDPCEHVCVRCGGCLDRCCTCTTGDLPRDEHLLPAKETA